MRASRTWGEAGGGRVSRRDPLDHHLLGRIDGLQEVQRSGLIGRRDRFAHHEGARQRVLVPVDLDFLIVGQFVAGVGDGVRGDDITRAQQIEQPAVQRVVVRLAVHRRVDRRDAVVQQIALRLDALHVGRVAFRDDRVVAAHVLQPVRHGGIGVEQLLVRRVEARQPPRLGRVLLILQPLHHRRLEVEQLRIRRRVEAVAEQPEVEDEEGE